jgi:ABC-type polysaccharide transport system permease subunit
MQPPKALTNLITTVLRKLYRTTLILDLLHLAFLLVCSLFFTVIMDLQKDSKEPKDYKDMVEYLPIKANKSMLRGLAYAVLNSHLMDKECYKALPNKLNYKESMFSRSARWMRLRKSHRRN